MTSYALVDCNNFFVSCERLFDPRLNGKAVIVLSNNDGCVVARSNETKALGIAMGEPYFKIKGQCLQHDIVIRSSNFSLYGDLSRRVMSILVEMAAEIEIYSIDEAFLMLPLAIDSAEIIAYCHEIRQRIHKWVGIPVSIGIASCKTLAKVAAAIAKKHPKGVVALPDQTAVESALRPLPVGEIWGIGSRLAARLHAQGIRSAWQLQQQEPGWIRKTLGVVGEKLLWELRGLSCLPLEKSKPKKSITYSRSFGRALSAKAEIAEALSTYVNGACVKLRQQNSCAKSLYVYLELIVDGLSGVYQHESCTATFIQPTSDTPTIISSAKRCLEKLWRSGRRYKKCGIVLLDLANESQVAPDLFLGAPDKKRLKLAATFDDINARFGKNTLTYGAMGINSDWQMRHENRSKQFSTAWDQLAIAKA